MNFEQNLFKTKDKYNGVNPGVYRRIEREAMGRIKLESDGTDASLAQRAIDLLNSDDDFIKIATKDWFEAITRTSDIEQTEKDLAKGLADRALDYVKNNIQEAA